MRREKYTAVVLAAGQGKRMGSRVYKQYLLLHEKPLIYYSLKAFEESTVDEVVLVVGKGEIDYCKKEIIEKYDLKKVRHIVEGGAQRYHSVACGLRAIKDTDYVLIHDGARPFLDLGIIERSKKAAKTYQASVIGMPVKDTIKLADSQEFAEKTPNRERIWMMQTPQAFFYPLVFQAYETLLEVEQGKIGESDKTLLNPNKIELLREKWEQVNITDDAMVVELLSDVPVKLIRGSYENIKITTPEDLRIAEVLGSIETAWRNNCPKK